MNRWLQRQSEIRIRASSEALNVTQPLTKSTSFGKMHLSEIINNLSSKLSQHESSPYSSSWREDPRAVRCENACVKEHAVLILKISTLWKHMFLARDVKWSLTSRNVTIAWFFVFVLSSGTFSQIAKNLHFRDSEGSHKSISLWRNASTYQYSEIYVSEKMYNGLNWLQTLR